MIKIWEPRYRDKTVLIATNKIQPEQDVEIQITKGFYKGEYKIKAEDIKNSRRELMKTKRGGESSVTVVPLSKLTKTN